MAKWHAQPEYLELFTDKPPMRAGFCVVDEDGRYYKTKTPEGEPSRLTFIDKQDAQDFADRLNAGERDVR